MSFGSETTSLANDLFAKTNSCFFLTPLYTYTHEHTHTHTHTHIHTHTHTFHLLTPHNGHDCICSIKQASANRPAELIVTQHWGTQELSRVQPPTNFAMQRESADEVYQHASLTPNSQKTTGNWRAPVNGWQEMEEKGGGMTFQKYLGWTQAQALEQLLAMRPAFLLTL